MDAKLNNQKWILMLLTLTAGCATQKNSDKYIYIEEYKLMYYRACLKYEFDNSTEINAILKVDKSAYGEPIIGYNYVIIDSIARARANSKVADSVSTKNLARNENDGKRILSRCLCEYESKWLEKMARRAYKKSKYN